MSTDTDRRAQTEDTVFEIDEDGTVHGPRDEHHEGYKAGQREAQQASGVHCADCTSVDCAGAGAEAIADSQERVAQLLAHRAVGALREKSDRQTEEIESLRSKLNAGMARRQHGNQKHDEEIARLTAERDEECERADDIERIWHEEAESNQEIYQRLRSEVSRLETKRGTRKLVAARAVDVATALVAARSEEIAQLRARITTLTDALRDGVRETEAPYAEDSPAHTMGNIKRIAAAALAAERPEETNP